MKNGVVSMRGNYKKSIKEVSDFLIREFDIQIGFVNMVSKKEYRVEGFKIIVLVFEKRYMRLKCHLSVTIILTETVGKQSADIIVSGYGGRILGKGWWSDYGASDDFMQEVVYAMQQNDFVVTDKPDL